MHASPHMLDCGHHEKHSKYTALGADMEEIEDTGY